MRKIWLPSIFLIAAVMAGFYLIHSSISEEFAPREHFSLKVDTEPNQGFTEDLRGRIVSINHKEQSFLLNQGMKAVPIYWGKQTVITVAHHPVKPSALVPGTTVVVQCQSWNDFDFARSIQVLPVR